MGVYIKSRFNYDPDALAFIQASSIPQTSQKLAINQLVLDLKAYGIWSKMRAIYPMVGGSAFYHKWNLKDPRDLDAAYRLNFVGGWTHSAAGAKPNGTNAYADTFLVSDTMALNSIHSSFYSRTNFTDNNYKINLGYLRTTPDSYSDIALDWNGVSVYRLNNGGVYTSVSSGGNNQGFYTVSRTASNVIRAFKNGSIILNAADASNVTANNRSFYIGAGNNNGTAQYFTPNECAFVSLGDGLTNTEAANFYTAVQTFQVTLGRSIGTQTVSDADAQAFVNAAVIEDQIQATAINQLVIDMKGYGIWNKMKAIYPFVGGTAASHKWNLKNPLDIDAAFRLVFSGGWTHSSTGATPNGVNAYANTFLNPSTAYSISTDAHLSFYSRTNNIENSIQIGTYNSITNTAFQIQIRNGAASPFNTRSIINNITWHETADTNSLGFYISNRSGTTVKNFKNNTNLGTGTNPAVTRPNSFLFIGAQSLNNSINLPSAKQCAFSSIGDGLTDTEAANFYTAVQNFQVALSRNV